MALLAGSLAQMEIAALRPSAAVPYVGMVEEAAKSWDAVSLVRLLLCRSLLESLAGRWEVVLSLCDRWLSEVRLAGRFQVATARLMWAEAASSLGRHGEALRAGEDAVHGLKDAGALPSLHLARMYARAGDDRTAAGLVARVQADVVTRPRSAAAKALLADLVAFVDPSLIVGLQAALLSEARPAVVGYVATSVQRVLGKVGVVRRDWSTSFAHFETAIIQLSEAGANWELAMTLADYARARRARGRRGDATRAASLEARATELLGTEAVAVGIPASGLPVKGDVFGLTARELEVLGGVAEGKRNFEIAQELSVSVHTVDRHLENIFFKMRVSSRTQAVLKAAEEGLLIVVPR